MRHLSVPSLQGHVVKLQTPVPCFIGPTLSVPSLQGHVVKREVLYKIWEPVDYLSVPSLQGHVVKPTKREVRMRMMGVFQFPLCRDMW